MPRRLFLAVVLVALALLLPVAGPAQDLPPETREHLVAAHAKWGMIELIFTGLLASDVPGRDDGRASLGYYCRQISTIAAPALARWVIRPERRHLGKEAEATLDAIHQRLEGFDLGIGFSNSPDPAVWQAGAEKFHALIRKGLDDLRAGFATVPNPPIRVSPAMQRDIVRDELRILSALLANQDDDHRWTPPQAGGPCPRPDEIARVARLHAQVLHIAASMAEYVLANRSALTPAATQTLVGVHRALTAARETSLRVLASGQYEWDRMHQAFHQAFDRAYHEVDSAWCSL